MRFRKLRIAWSVAWAITAVLLCVLWVRSYWWRDWLGFNEFYAMLNMRLRFSESVEGMLRIEWEDPFGGYLLKDLEFSSDTVEDQYGEYGASDVAWGLNMTRYYFSVGVSHWFAVLAVLIATAVPWLRWQFSLRTLLIATTLVAVVLGLIAWLR